MRSVLLISTIVLLVVSQQGWPMDTLSSESPQSEKAAVPDFGPNVLVFDPSMPTTAIQGQIDAVYSRQERNQFGVERNAFLFKPGKYDLDVQIGFYTQAIGLGKFPDDVAITGAVRSKARWMRGNATLNFWRSAENLSVTPTQDEKVNIWAVSQGTALRRVHVRGDLNLSDGGWSSGGFMADSKIDGLIDSGTQQQWCSRNSAFGHWTGGAWNMVFVGTINPPVKSWPAGPYTVIEKTPIIREKPFLYIDGERYFVAVPNLATDGTLGMSWSNHFASARAMPLSQFYIAHAETDTAATMNSALKRGKNLLLTPGVYHLESAIQVSNPGTVVLGLGFPSLMPDRGTAAMTIADVDGVKVGGILFEAGASNSPTLFEVGVPGSSASHATDPVFLYDIFARVGGASLGTATCMVTINSHDVVGDNLWLWRADHGRGVGWDSNRNATGLIVNGDNVTLYGLFVEHCQQYQTLWNANGGRVYFYQSEMPYDPPNQEAWCHGESNGYASYRVADSVRTHEAWGLGVYCAFRYGEGPVIADDAIETPTAPAIKMHHLIAVRLGWRDAGGISHVINGTGTMTGRTAVVD